jgi:NAD(P)-dependent dehydrogenase (short-subunit alcohol dehydrogenase family)
MFTARAECLTPHRKAANCANALLAERCPAGPDLFASIAMQLAPAYVYLASDEASYTSGTTLGVAGGMPLN